MNSALLSAGWGWVGLLVLLGAGCGKEEVRVYRVPKEKATAPPDAHALAHGGNVHGGNLPPFTWKTPAGWEQQQDSAGVRIVHFGVRGPEGQTADVGVVPLTGAAVSRGDLVNMVRSSIELGQATEEDLARQAEKVTVGPLQGELFEMVSTNALVEQKFKARILMASVQQDKTLWLFKIAGADELVRAQRPAFLDFLKSIQFGAASAAGAVPAPAAPAGVAPPAAAPAGKPQWSVPAGWQEQAPGPMVIARFALAHQDAKAEVTVSVFPGDTGGLLANVNRWRGQVGLAPVEAAELPKLTESLDAPAGKVTLVDMTGTDRKTGKPARMIGGMLPRGGQTWFFKLLGDAPVAEREKAALLKFIQSTKFPDA
jgi:hypothetical protein